MRNVTDNLYVGSADSLVNLPDDFYVVHAAKIPWHKDLVGYKTRALPKTHEHYLWIEKPGELALNLIDADDCNYIPREVITKGVLTIANKLCTGPVLVHCNKGQSRSPIVAMLYMAYAGEFKSKSFEEAEIVFKKLYPFYNPGKGMREFAVNNWRYYNGDT